MHVSQITELDSCTQFSEILILRQILNSKEDGYLSEAEKIRGVLYYSGHKFRVIAVVIRLIGSQRKQSQWL